MTGIDAVSSPFHRVNLALPVKQKQHQLKLMLNFSSTRNSFIKSYRDYQTITNLKTPCNDIRRQVRKLSNSQSVYNINTWATDIFKILVCFSTLPENIIFGLSSAVKILRRIMCYQKKRDLLFVKVSFCSVQPVARYSCEISEISFHSLSHPGTSSL